LAADPTDTAPLDPLAEFWSFTFKRRGDIERSEVEGREKRKGRRRLSK